MITTQFFNIVDGYPDQIQRVVIDDKTYEVRFIYNERGESWTMYIGDVGADPTVSFKLSSFTLHLTPYNYSTNLPAGEIVAAALQEDSARITQYNVGPSKQIELWYNSP
ncbi:MAG TPA: hypothetical protein DCY22_02320 [Bacteroides graminisolvens]|nr:hypothetical protein [Bacteroides graminisolvens]